MAGATPQRFALQPGAMFSRVECQVTDGQLLLARLGGVRPAEDGPQPRLEVVDREWLHQVVIGASIEERHDLGLVVACGSHDHRHGGDRPNHAKRLGAVDVGTPEVEHDRVEPTGNGEFHALHRLAGGLDTMAEVGEM
jgi:hypothetical protein